MKKSLEFIILILLCDFLLSCKDKTDLPVTDAELPIQIAIPDSLRKIQNLDQLVVEIEKQESLEGKYIGYGGQLSTQRDYYQDLLKLADTIYLLKLTSSKNPLVRVISFDVLNAKGYSEIKKVFKDHITDNETYNVYGGCLITPEPVNLSMYETIKNKLTIKQKVVFGNLIKQELKKSKYRAFSLLEAGI